MVTPAVRTPEATLQVINKGHAPVVNLRVRCEGRETEVGTIEPGESVSIPLATRGETMVVLKFSQKGSALSGVEIEDFNAPALRSSGQKKVIGLQEAGYEGYAADDPSLIQGLTQRVKNAISNALWGD